MFPCSMIFRIFHIVLPLKFLLRRSCSFYKFRFVLHNLSAALIPTHTYICINTYTLQTLFPLQKIGWCCRFLWKLQNITYWQRVLPVINADCSLPPFSGCCCSMLSMDDIGVLVLSAAAHQLENSSDWHHQLPGNTKCSERGNAISGITRSTPIRRSEWGTDRQTGCQSASRPTFLSFHRIFCTHLLTFERCFNEFLTLLPLPSSLSLSTLSSTIQTWDVLDCSSQVMENQKKNYSPHLMVGNLLDVFPYCCCCCVMLDTFHTEQIQQKQRTNTLKIIEYAMSTSQQEEQQFVAFNKNSNTK